MTEGATKRGRSDPGKCRVRKGKFGRHDCPIKQVSRGAKERLLAAGRGERVVGGGGEKTLRGCVADWEYAFATRQLLKRMDGSLVNSNDHFRSSSSRERTPRSIRPSSSSQHSSASSRRAHAQVHSQDATIPRTPSFDVNSVLDGWVHSSRSPLNAMGAGQLVESYNGSTSPLQRNSTTQSPFTHRTVHQPPLAEQSLRSPVGTTGMDFDAMFLPSQVPFMEDWAGPSTYNDCLGPDAEWSRQLVMHTSEWLARDTQYSDLYPRCQPNHSMAPTPSQDALTYDMLGSFSELGLTATPSSSPRRSLATPPLLPSVSAPSQSSTLGSQMSYDSITSSELSAYSTMDMSEPAFEGFSPPIAPSGLPPSPNPMMLPLPTLAGAGPSKPSPPPSTTSQTTLSKPVTPPRSPNFGYRTPRFPTREAWAAAHLDAYGVFIPPNKCSDGKWSLVNNNQTSGFIPSSHSHARERGAYASSTTQYPGTQLQHAHAQPPAVPFPEHLAFQPPPQNGFQNLPDLADPGAMNGNLGWDQGTNVNPGWMTQPELYEPVVATQYDAGPQDPFAHLPFLPEANPSNSLIPDTLPDGQSWDYDFLDEILRELGVQTRTQARQMTANVHATGVQLPPPPPVVEVSGPDTQYEHGLQFTQQGDDARTFNFPTPHAPLLETSPLPGDTPPPYSSSEHLLAASSPYATPALSSPTRSVHESAYSLPADEARSITYDWTRSTDGTSSLSFSQQTATAAPAFSPVGGPSRLPSTPPPPPSRKRSSKRKRVEEADAGPARKKRAPRKGTGEPHKSGDRPPGFKSKAEWEAAHLDADGELIPPTSVGNNKWQCACMRDPMKAVDWRTIQERHRSYREVEFCTVEGCGKPFSRLDALLRHLRAQHKMKIEKKNAKKKRKIEENSGRQMGSRGGGREH
ncbi:unnamed protein product [Peniophora sp. CBMAI 1063]|nr:unnamed protein product [Peniophora sp. CBMAI 1063]